MSRNGADVAAIAGWQRRSRHYGRRRATPSQRGACSLQGEL